MTRLLLWAVEIIHCSHSGDTADCPWPFCRAAISELRNGKPDTHLAFMQAKVLDWVTRCFGASQANGPDTRALRLAEESIEFCQAVNVDAEKLHKLIDYVYSRPAGKPFQELGGVGITFLAAAAAIDCQATEVLQAEMDRILAKTPEYFAARNQVKCEAGFK